MFWASELWCPSSGFMSFRHWFCASLSFWVDPHLAIFSEIRRQREQATATTRGKEPGMLEHIEDIQVRIETTSARRGATVLVWMQFENATDDKLPEIDALTLALQAITETLRDRYGVDSVSFLAPPGSIRYVNLRRPRPLA